jgi:hypothetical protein
VGVKAAPPSTRPLVRPVCVSTYSWFLLHLVCWQRDLQNKRWTYPGQMFAKGRLRKPTHQLILSGGREGRINRYEPTPGVMDGWPVRLPVGSPGGPCPRWLPAYGTRKALIRDVC